MKVSLVDVTTTSADVGTSVREIKLQAKARRLTEGEVEMARMVFKSSINYSTVVIHDRGYGLLFGLQGKDRSVTPNGQIYAGENHYKSDYSKSGAFHQGIFIHEMTHVWQYQRGYPVMAQRIRHPRMKYDYVLVDGGQLSILNLEAQADVLADYFLRLTVPPDFRKGASVSMKNNTLSDYVRFLDEFIADPTNALNLPRAGR